MTLLKGALVRSRRRSSTPVPNVTVFQYNPESLTHTWSQPDRGASAAASAGREAGNPLAVPGMPGEEFSLTVIFDSNEDIADNVPDQRAARRGLRRLHAAGRARDAAVPGQQATDDRRCSGPASAALASSAAAGAGARRTVPDSTMPVVLFSGARTGSCPVRVTALTIIEKLYDAAAQPGPRRGAAEAARADPDRARGGAGRQRTSSRGLATVAYTYTLGMRQVGRARQPRQRRRAVAGML